MVDPLSLRIVGCSVQVRCQDAATRALLVANFGHMQDHPEPPVLRYAVGGDAKAGGFWVRQAGQKSQPASDPGELLFLIEKDLTVEIETLRPELYFVHAAVLAFDDQAVMFVGASGSGKSTTAWGLLHHGGRYYSDELAPVDVQTGEVHPYPHALCLKGVPPAPYPLPRHTLYTPRTLHIPTMALPGPVGGGPAPLAAIFFLHYRPGATTPAIAPVSHAEAATRLFANALNPLAHAGGGLDAAIAVCTRVAAVKLCAADLSATCALVKATLTRLLRNPEATGCREEQPLPR